MTIQQVQLERAESFAFSCVLWNWYFKTRSLMLHSFLCHSYCVALPDFAQLPKASILAHY